LAGRASAIAAGAASRAARNSAQLGAQPFGSNPSPLLASYQQWSMGQSSYTALPRDPSLFVNGAFAPLTPLVPTPINQPPEGRDRPEPRRWQYPVAWNLPIGQPGTEGLKLVDFSTLRLYSDLYSIARACIQLRKDEITGLDWDIVPTRVAGKLMQDNKRAMRDFGERKEKIVRFFRKPDSNFHDYGSWLSALLEDIFVIDALSLYLAPPRLRGRGVLGSELSELQLLDGSTIRPLIDLRGGKPKPPNPAYQSYQYGVPRVDLMTLINGEDEAEGPVQEYRGDQLYYLPRWPRAWTVYGQSPLERVIIPVMAHLRKQQYQLEFFTEGTIPGMFVSPGDPAMTPNQIRELQENLNVIAGDQAWKHKLLVLPPGSKVSPQKPPALAGEDDTVLMTEVCMGYSVMPTELGIIPQLGPTVSTAAIRMFSQASQGIHQRKATIPDLKWLASIFNKVIQEVLGQDDMEWFWEGIEEETDQQTLNQNLIAQLEHGGLTIDEFRQENGRDPLDLPLTREPVWATSSGLVPLAAMTGNAASPQAQAQASAALAGIVPGGGGNPARPLNSVLPQQPAQAAPGRAIAEGAGGVQGRRAAAKMFERPAAAAAEMAALRRHLNKGRDPATWESRHLPEQMMNTIVAASRNGLHAEAREYLGLWEDRARKVVQGKVEAA
jgi:hypothetical protein